MYGTSILNCLYFRNKVKNKFENWKIASFDFRFSIFDFRSFEVSKINHCLCESSTHPQSLSEDTIFFFFLFFFFFFASEIGMCKFYSANLWAKIRLASCTELTFLFSVATQTFYFGYLRVVSTKWKQKLYVVCNFSLEKRKFDFCYLRVARFFVFSQSHCI